MNSSTKVTFLVLVSAYRIDKYKSDDLQICHVRAPAKRQTNYYWSSIHMNSHHKYNQITWIRKRYWNLPCRLYARCMHCTCHLSCLLSHSTAGRVGFAKALCHVSFLSWVSTSSIMSIPKHLPMTCMLKHHEEDMKMLKDLYTKTMEVGTACTPPHSFLLTANC